jgi:hypothetical protein
MVAFLVDTLALAFAVCWVVIPTIVFVLLARALREKPPPFDAASLEVVETEPAGGDGGAVGAGPRHAVLIP